MINVVTHLHFSQTAKIWLVATDITATS